MNSLNRLSFITFNIEFFETLPPESQGVHLQKTFSVSRTRAGEQENPIVPVHRSVQQLVLQHQLSSIGTIVILWTPPQISGGVSYEKNISVGTNRACVLAFYKRTAY